MPLTEMEVTDILNDHAVDTSLLVSSEHLEGNQYQLEFETLEVDYNEEEILDSLETAGLEPENAYLESPMKRGSSTSPTDVFDFFYVIVTLD